MKHQENRLIAVAQAFEKAHAAFVNYGMTGKTVFAVFQSGGAMADVMYSATAKVQCIFIDGLETHPASRGKGDATHVLQTVFDVADNICLPVMLEAVPLSHKEDDGVRMTLDELVAWYTKRGFVLTKKNDGYCDMIRPVRVLAAA